MNKEEIRKLAILLYELMKKDELSEFKNLLLKSLENERTGKLNMVKTPVLNTIGKELGKLIAKEDWKFERLLKLWRLSFENAKRLEYGITTGREIRYVVINALGEISKKDYESAKKFVLIILNDLNDWETVDALALRVVVNLAKQNREEVFQLLNKWVASESKWIRRLAMATIAPYIRAKPNNAKLCLEVIEKLMQENDKDVKKAVAWALREISKKNAEAVYNFLQKYGNSKDVSTRWIIREGSRKLPENLRKKLGC